MTVTATPAAPKATKARAPRKPKTVTPANPVISEEQAAALTPAVPTPATPAETPAMATPGAYTDADLEALVSQYTAADAAERESKDMVKQAKLSFEDTRVLKSIIIWKVAMLEPYKGAPNATFAAKHLRMTPEERAKLTPAQLKAKASSLKKAFTYYIRAGVALDAAGLALDMRPVDQNMRDIVREAFKRTDEDKANKSGGAADTAGEGAGEGDAGEAKPISPDALTVADLMGHVGRMKATLELMMSSKVAITEAESRELNDELTTLALTINAYAEGEILD